MKTEEGEKDAWNSSPQERMKNVSQLSTEQT